MTMPSECVATSSGGITATAAGALTTAVLATGLITVPVGGWLDARYGHGKYSQTV